MSNKAVKKRNLPVSGTYGNPDSFREKLLEKCGLNVDRQADLVNQSVAQLEKDLTATKTVIVATPRGIHTQEVKDNTARSKAREQVFALTGANAPKTNINTTVRTVIEIDWPDFMKPTIDAESVKEIEGPEGLPSGSAPSADVTLS